jgi:hypothetical protein
MSKYTEIKLEKLGRFLRHLELQESRDEKLIQAVKNQMEYFTNPERFKTG